MERPNPFLSVPTLLTFAREVAHDLAAGARVLAVLGPYQPRQFLHAVARLTALDEADVRVLGSTAQVRDSSGAGSARLVVARALHVSAELYAGTGCEGWYGAVRVCPTGLTRTELRGLAFSMIAREELSGALRTMVIDFCCELSAGSVETLSDALEVCLRPEYRPPAAFVHPGVVAAECARRQVGRLRSRAEAGDGLPGAGRASDADLLVARFRRSIMGGLSRSEPLQGATDPGARSVGLDLMWWLNWSYGLCARLDGVWSPGWGVLMSGERAWEPVDDAGASFDVCRAGTVFSDVVSCREASAMQVGFGPVWERYKAHAIARVLDCGGRPEDEVGRFLYNGERRVIRRFSDMPQAGELAQQDPEGWGLANDDGVSFRLAKELRNNVSHGQVERVGARDLEALGRMLAELERYERNPSAPRYRRCFC